MKCQRCQHPLAAHYPGQCWVTMYGGRGQTCDCRWFVYPAKKPAPIPEGEARALDGNR